MKLKRTLFCFALLLCLLALPAFAEGEAKIASVTPETTIGAIREDPEVIASGIWTYQKAVEDGSPAPETLLKDYVGDSMAQDCASAMNLLLDTYRAGQQVTYKVYTPEQIAEEPARNEAELYYFPAETKGGKYVLVMSGNVLNKTANLSEGYATAWQLHELGYTVFVLRYRVFRQAKNNAPSTIWATRWSTSPGMRRPSASSRRITHYWDIPRVDIWPGSLPTGKRATAIMRSPNPVRCFWGIPSTISLNISRSTT